MSDASEREVFASTSPAAKEAALDVSNPRTPEGASRYSAQSAFYDKANRNFVECSSVLSAFDDVADQFKWNLWQSQRDDAAPRRLLLVAQVRAHAET